METLTMSAQDLRREIDSLKHRARAGHSARRTEQLLPAPELLRRVESAECSAELVAETLRALADSLPGLQPIRRLAEDGWVVGLWGAERAAADGLRVRSARSRIEICVSSDKLRGTLRLVCRRCVADRELDVLHHELPLLNATGLTLTAWVEGACLGFAAALLARRATRPCAQASA